ncbi:ComF family protein [Streptomyces sp. NPDC050619]|uniref:ComF family protein n=1 Tax=Streptomyces sp. NPDC050619 TaxID=3157214 RepID=UPI003437A2F5
MRAGLREAWVRAEDEEAIWAGGRDAPGVEEVVRGGLREARVRGEGSVRIDRGARADRGIRVRGSVSADGSVQGDGSVRGDGGMGTGRGVRAGSSRAGLQRAPVWGDEVVLLVPVPSAPGMVRARGHDPARRIALAAAGELRRAGTPARVLAVLRQRRAVADQSGLNSRQQRLENLAGALAVAPGGGRLLRGGPVVLVDDLMTTGASLTEAARAVRAAMAEDGLAEESVAGEAVAYGTTVRGRDAVAYGTTVRVAEGGACGRAVRVAGAVVNGTTVSVEGEVVYRRPGSAQEAVGYGRSGGVVQCREGAAAVYAAATREGTRERMIGAAEEETGRAPVGPGIVGAGVAGDVICAAVVAATPDSFEINRN